MADEKDKTVSTVPVHGGPLGGGTTAPAPPPVGPKAPTTAASTAPHAGRRTQDFAFNPKQNGWFRIKGNHFGAGGTVTVGGHSATLASWSTTEIEGCLPEGVTSGEVVVHVGADTKQYGYFDKAV